MSMIAIDMGSTRIKGMLTSACGAPLAAAETPMPILYGARGTVEIPFPKAHRQVDDLIRKLAGGSRDDRVDTLVFSCLGTVAIPTDHDGKPLANGMSPLDFRSGGGPELLEDSGLDPSRIRLLTGQKPSCSSFLHQWLWMRRHRPQVLAKTSHLLSLRSFLVRHYTGEIAEDFSWASRTMLMDIRQGAWSGEILCAAGIDPSLLPPPVSANESFPLREPARQRLGLVPGARVVMGGMDNCCAYAGVGTTRSDILVNLAGTYEHLMDLSPLANLDTESIANDAFAFRYLWPDQFLTLCRLETGHGLNHLAKTRGLSPKVLNTCLAQIDPASPTADASTNVVRELLADAAFRLRRYLDDWERSHGFPAAGIVVVGGGAQHRCTLELKANILGCKLLVPREKECGCLGALQVAATARGVASRKTAGDYFPNPIVDTIVPDAAATDRWHNWKWSSNDN